MIGRSGGCEAYRDMLFDYIGDADAAKTTEYKEKWGELEAHLLSCAQCRAELAACRGMLAAIKDASYDAPPELRKRIGSALRVESKRAKRNKFIKYFGSAAAALLIFAGVGIAMLIGKGNLDTDEYYDKNGGFAETIDMTLSEGYVMDNNDGADPNGNVYEPNGVPDGVPGDIPGGDETITDEIKDAADKNNLDESRENDASGGETAPAQSSASALFESYCSEDYRSGYIYILHGEGPVARNIISEIADTLSAEVKVPDDNEDGVGCEYYVIIEFSTDNVTSIDNYATKNSVALSPEYVNGTKNPRCVAVFVVPE